MNHSANGNCFLLGLVDVPSVVLIARESLTGEADRLVQFLFQQCSWRQFSQVLGDSDSAFVQPQQFDVFFGFVGTQDQTDRRFFAGMDIMFLQPPEIELHLTFVGRLKLAQLQINRDQTPQPTMVEQQIEVIVLVVDCDSLLSSDEGEIRPHLKDEGLQFPQDGVFNVFFGVL